MAGGSPRPGVASVSPPSPGRLARIAVPDGCAARRAAAAPGRSCGPGRHFPVGRQLRGLPQRADHRVGRGRLDRFGVARVDDGQLVARPVLAGCCPARGDRSSRRRSARSRTSARSATCRWPADQRESVRDGHGEVFAHLPVGERSTLDDRAGGGWRVVHGLPPNRSAGPGHARELHRRLLDREPHVGDAHDARTVRDRRGAARRSCARRPASRRVRRATCRSRSCARPATRSSRPRSAPKGEPIGSLPEQVPYLEWRHSSFRDRRSCQACHMPVGRSSDADCVGAGRAA